MSMIEEWIEEFLYRGRPPSGSGADEAPAWHVVIGQQVDSPFGGGEKSRRLVGPLPFAQAEEAGWPVTRLIADINEEAVKRVNELGAIVSARDAEIVDMKAQMAQAQADLDAAATQLADLLARSIQPASPAE